MLATLIIVFREMLEAGLIIGIVLAATSSVKNRGLWVTGGVLAGILGACVVAAFAGSISSAMAGVGQEVFNASVLGIAVLMLTWHNVWMAKHGREMAMQMREVGADVSSGKRSLLAVAIVVALAVLREGSEVVLFLYGIAISGNESPAAMASGGALGVALGGIVSALMYFGLLRIPTRHLFRVTGWLIALLAAGMAAQASVFLQQAQIITVLDMQVWDSSAILPSSSIIGQALHTLIGYNDQPTGLELVAYIATLVVIFTLMRVFGHKPAKV